MHKMNLISRCVWALRCSSPLSPSMWQAALASDGCSLTATRSSSTMNKFIDASFLDGGSPPAEPDRQPLRRPPRIPLPSPPVPQRHAASVPQQEGAPNTPHVSVNSYEDFPVSDIPTVGDMQLTQNIMRSAQPTDLLSLLLSSAGAGMNPLHVSATSTRLAGMAREALSSSNESQPTLPSPGPRPTLGLLRSREMEQPQAAAMTEALGVLLGPTQKQLSAFRARQLANSCWGAAKCVSTGAVSLETASPLVVLLLQQASRPGALLGIKARELALLAWAAYIMRMHDKELLAAVADAAKGIEPDRFRDHEVVNILQLFAAAAQPQPQLCRHLCSFLLAPGQMSSMEPRLVQQLAFVCSRSQYRSPKLAHALSMRSSQLLDQYSVKQLCGLAASLSDLHCDDAKLYEMMAARVQPALLNGQAVNSRDVSDLLWGLVSAPVLGNAGGGCWTRSSLMQAAMPALLKCTGKKDSAKAALVLSAELLAGNQQATAGLLSLWGKVLHHLELDPQLIPTGLIRSMVTTLPQVLRSMAETSANGARLIPHSELSGESAFARPGSVAGGSSRPLIGQYAAALRSVAMARLVEFDREDRPVVLRELLEAADLTGEDVAA